MCVCGVYICIYKLTIKKSDTMTTFRKVKLEIARGNGYGQYIVIAQYKGKLIHAHTTDSETFDWLNDDSDKVKHQEAKRYAYSLIVNAFNNL